MARSLWAVAALLLLPPFAAASAHELQATSSAPPVFDFTPPIAGSYALPPIKAAADGRVLDSDGTAHHLHELLRGKVTLLSFVYTSCADPFGCPLATGALFDLFDASAMDPQLRRGVQLLSLSFDPAHDTPARMADYGAAALAQAGEGRCSWRFLTTTGETELSSILDGYGQRIDRRLAHEPGSTINHLLRVYLIDPDLRVRNIYGVEFLDPRLLLADVRTLLLEHDAR